MTDTFKKTQYIEKFEELYGTTWLNGGTYGQIKDIYGDFIGININMQLQGLTDRAGASGNFW